MKPSTKPTEPIKAKRGRPPSRDPLVHLVAVKLNADLWRQLRTFDRALGGGSQGWIVRKALTIALPIMAEERQARERARLARQRA